VRCWSCWPPSAFDLIWQSMRLASLLLGGLFADTAGIRAVYYLGGILLAAAALAGFTADAQAHPLHLACRISTSAPGRCPQTASTPGDATSRLSAAAPA
jgi:hypothetical protein